MPRCWECWVMRTPPTGGEGPDTITWEKDECPTVRTEAIWPTTWWSVYVRLRSSAAKVPQLYRLPKYTNKMCLSTPSYILCLFTNVISCPSFWLTCLTNCRKRLPTISQLHASESHHIPHGSASHVYAQSTIIIVMQVNWQQEECKGFAEHAPLCIWYTYVCTLIFTVYNETWSTCWGSSSAL